MLKPIEKFSYRHGHYVAAIGLACAEMLWQSLAQGGAETQERFLSPKAIGELRDVTAESVFVRRVCGIGYVPAILWDSLHCLKPLAQKLPQIIPSASEMSAGIPVSSDQTSEAASSQRYDGDLSGVKFELRHLLAWLGSSFLVGLIGYLWGSSSARLEKPYSIGGNTSL
jgi:hypothetical protein